MEGIVEKCLETIIQVDGPRSAHFGYLRPEMAKKAAPLLEPPSPEETSRFPFWPGGGTQV